MVETADSDPLLSKILWTYWSDLPKTSRKIFSPTYPRRGAETAEEYNKMVEAECIEELGWTPEQYTELVQLRQARQARERGPESRGDNRPMQFSLPSTDDIGRFPGKVTESAKRYLFGSGASRGAAVQPNRPVFQRVRPR